MPDTTLGVLTRPQRRVARVDPLGRVAEEEVGAGPQAGPLEDRPQQLLGRARVRRRLEHDQRARPQDAGQGPVAASDVGQVGDAVAQRGGHGDDRDVEAGRRPGRSVGR